MTRRAPLSETYALAGAAFDFPAVPSHPGA